MSDKTYVSWKKVIDTGITPDSTPGVVAVGDGGLLYPFEHRASYEGIKFKSICQYRDGMLIIGDWKMFILSATSQNIETTMSADVVDCTSITDSNGIQHVYIVTSEGHVLYTSSDYPEYSFKITKNVSDGFVGCRSFNVNGKLTVILYGKSLLIGTPGAPLSSFKRIVPSVAIDSISILPNGNILIFDEGTQSLDVLSSDKEIVNKIGFIDFINNKTGSNCKFTSVYICDNILYLLGSCGIIAMIKLSSSGDIEYDEPISQMDGYYNVKNFYFTKISDIEWNDMVKVDNYFIGVGEGDIDKSSFVIDNLPEFIISHDYRHRRVDYSNEIIRLANKNNTKYVIRNDIDMNVDNNGHPYFNLCDFLQIDDKSIIDKLLPSIEICIMPIRGSISGKQNWEYKIQYTEKSMYVVHFPQLKCNHLFASITIKL